MSSLHSKRNRLYISYGLWEHTTAWSESSSSTTHQTKLYVYYTLSDVLKRVKGSKWLIVQPSLLTHAGWNIEIVDQVSSFLALFVVAAQPKHTSAIWESSWKNTKKNLRRIDGFMLQMHQTYHDALFFGHTLSTFSSDFSCHSIASDTPWVRHNCGRLHPDKRHLEPHKHSHIARSKYTVCNSDFSDFFA